MRYSLLIAMFALIGCGGGSGPSAPAIPRTVVFLGDSLAGGSGFAPGVTDFPDLIPGIISINRGIGGNTSAQMLARLQECFVPLPKTLVLECGLNDLNRNVSPADFTANIRAIVKGCKSQGVSVVLCTVTPATVDYVHDLNTLDAYNATIKQIADDSGCGVADLHAAFPADPSPLLEPDNLHPNQQGQNLIAATIAPLLQ